MLVKLNGASLSGLNATQIVRQIGSTAGADRDLVVRRKPNATASAPTSAPSPMPAAEPRETEVEVVLPLGRLRVAFEDGPNGVFVDAVNDESPAKGMVRLTGMGRSVQGHEC